MKKVSNYILFLFTILFFTGSASYGNNLPQIQEDLPATSEDLQKQSPQLWAYLENSGKSHLEIEDQFLLYNISSYRDAYLCSYLFQTDTYSDYIPDLRRLTFQKLFPKHFFL